jgi:outer membrane protein assembly factor BamE (lipoprotein component of BamABCDE complex)
MKFWMLLLIPVIAFSIGCGQPYIVGTPIEKAQLDQIVPGTTTEGKVVELFGQPLKKEKVSADTTKYVYSYYEEQPRVWTKNIRIKHTLDVYAKGGVVQKYDLKKEGVDSVSK